MSPAVPLPITRRIKSQVIPSHLSANSFKLFNKGSNLLKYPPFHLQELRIQRTHRGQDGVEFGTAVTGVFAAEGGRDITLRRFFIQVFFGKIGRASCREREEITGLAACWIELSTR